MSIERYLKARNLVRRITLVTNNKDKPLYLFSIKDQGEVSFNHKGWKCSCMEDEENYQKKVALAIKQGKEIPTRWSCSYGDHNYECYHIIACKMFMERWTAAQKNEFVAPNRILATDTPEQHETNKL